MIPSGHALGLPGISPSGRGQFPRLQLRGSAGFSPASLSSPSGKDARSERNDKEQKTITNNSPKNLTAARAEVKYVGWPILAAFFAARVGILISTLYLDSIRRPTRRPNGSPSLPQPRHDIQHNRNHHAHHHRRCQRKIKCRILPPVQEVSR